MPFSIEANSECVSVCVSSRTIILSSLCYAQFQLHPSFGDRIKCKTVHSLMIRDLSVIICNLPFDRHLHKRMKRRNNKARKRIANKAEEGSRRP